MDYEIITDGKTVWVNGVEGNIARFGANGIDIHRPPSEQGDKGQCLHCTQGPVTQEHWAVFVEKMLQHHGIAVSDKFKPERFR